MKEGYAVVHLFNSVIENVKVFTILEDAHKCWFGHIKKFMDEKPDFIQFCKEEDGVFGNFIRAIESNDVAETIEAYNLIDWEEDEEFRIVECEINN